MRRRWHGACCLAVPAAACWPASPAAVAAAAASLASARHDAHMDIGPACLLQEDPGKVDYSSIGGLSEQIRWVLQGAGQGSGGAGREKPTTAVWKGAEAQAALLRRVALLRRPLRTDQTHLPFCARLPPCPQRAARGC